MDATNDLDNLRDRYLAYMGEGEWFTDGGCTFFALDDQDRVVTVPDAELHLVNDLV